jgi:type I restriction-modification system DNA methylase subunit
MSMPIAIPRLSNRALRNTPSSTATLQEAQRMDQASHNKIVSFIWSIADDCLRDVYVRGKYRDVILPMFALGRQVGHMAAKNVLFDVLEKFTAPHINLSPEPATDPDGRKLPPLTNLGMG